MTRSNWWKKLGSESGNVVMIFALSIIPIFAVAGFSIDFQHTVKKKQKVQLIIYSAVLAAARIKQTGASTQEVRPRSTPIWTPSWLPLMPARCARTRS